MKALWRKEPPTVDEVRAGLDRWWHCDPASQFGPAMYVFDDRPDRGGIVTNIGYDFCVGFDPASENTRETFGIPGCWWAICEVPDPPEATLAGEGNGVELGPRLEQPR